MSLTPAFELELWNTWIFILPVIVLSVIIGALFGKRGSFEDLGPTKKRAFIKHSSIVFASYAYTIFLKDLENRKYYVMIKKF